MNKIAMIYITCANGDEARKIANHLLKKRLIACANIFKIKSLYWWQCKITDDGENVLIVKTLEKNYEKIKSEAKKIHSYTIPCILKIEAEANKAYYDWLCSQILTR